MKNIFLFIATLTEALPILNLNNSTSEHIINKIKIKSFTIDNFNVHIIRTGIGSKNTTYTLAALSNFISSGVIVNIGIAGALKPVFEIGEWLSVNEFFSTEDERKIIINQLTKLPSTNILTSSKEIAKKIARDNFCNKYSANLVDMESFYIANFAREKNLPCCVIKMVSDHADENVSQFFNAFQKIYNNTAANIFKKFILQNEKIISYPN